MMTKIRSTLGFLLLACCEMAYTQVACSQEEEGVISISTTVTGNQEQPKVLYIVPWKPATDNSVLDQPLETQMKEIFKHVDRPEHSREINYRIDMNTQKEAKAK